MGQSLYDHELDGLPPTYVRVPKVNAFARPRRQDIPGPSRVKAAGGHGRPTFEERIAAASLAKVIGYSLAAGVLASAPLVFAMRPGPDARPKSPAPPPPEPARAVLSPETPKIEPPRVDAPAHRVEANPGSRTNLDAMDPPGPDPREEFAERRAAPDLQEPVPPEVPAARGSDHGDRTRRKLGDMARRMAKARNQAMLNVINQQIDAGVQQTLIRAATTARPRLFYTIGAPFGFNPAPFSDTGP